MVVIEKRDQTRQAVRDCRACQEACLRAELRFLQRGGTEHDFIVLLQAAASAWSMTADSLAHRSELAGHTAAVSAEICERFLRDCERRRDDPVVRRCIEKCRRTLQICQRLCGADTAA